MKQSSIFWLGALVFLLIPILACGPSSYSQVTPTPTKTPKRVLALEETPIPVASPTPAPTNTPIVAPTDTPTPPPPPTDTPPPLPTDTPLPPPTDTPLPPPPPPTFTPAPPPPTFTPAPPPPTQPPASALDVIIELPEGNEFGAGDDIKVVFIVRDPNGVSKFEWGIFTQNQTSLKGGKKECGGATECRIEVKEQAPPVSGTYIVGADAISSNGATKRGVGEIYISD